MMKLFVAVLLIAGVAVADLSPRHVEPKIPRSGRSGSRVPTGRITNGEVAADAQFPYQVGLSLHIGANRAWCGGSMISDRYIVTAAHCTDSASGVDVTMGTNTIKADSPGKQVVYVSSDNIVIHPGWNPSTLINDISLIKLPAPVTFNKYIQPIKLPAIGSYSSYAGDIAVASGWGKDSDSATTVSEVLRFIDVPVMTNSDCSKYYFGSIKQDHICIRTGSEHKSTCNGDSGGPLVSKGVLIGATSFGIALGCEVGFPGVFTRISSYTDWIQSITGPINN